MGQAAPNVFISYRRTDTSGYASWIHDRLEREFGRGSVFMDVDSLPLGTDFVDQLNQALERTDVALVLIGPSWLDARDETGARRLEHLDDYVRMELTEMLRRGTRVIPVLVDGAVMPQSSLLPEELRWLTRRQALSLARQGGMHDLVHVLNEARPKGVAAPPRRGRRLLSSAVLLAGAAAAVIIVLLIPNRGGGISRVKVGLHPHAIAFGDGSVWVADFSLDTVTQLNARSERVSSSGIPVGTTPIAIAVSQGNVWVSNQIGQSVTRIAATSGKVLATIPVGFEPGGSAVGANAVWITNPFGGTVAQLEPASNHRSLNQTAVGKGANAVAIEQGVVWIAGGVGSDVIRMDERSGKVVARIPIAHESDGIVVAQGSVWTLSTLSDSVSRIAPGTNTVESTILVGDSPEGIAAGAGSIWVTNNGSDTVTRIDATSGKVVATIPVGSHPSGIAFGDGRIWVADAGDGTVAIIPA